MSTRNKLQYSRLANPISSKEKLIFIIGALQIAFAIWGVGLIHLWLQWVFLGLSALGCFVAFFPQQVDSRFQDPEQSPSAAWMRLRRFPLFWFAFPLFIYIVLQGLNPAFGYEENPQTWRAFPIDHITWLPSGVDSPLYKMNAWRLLLMMGGVLLMVTYLHVGLLRRRLWVAMLWLIAVQAVLFSVLAFAQIKTGADKIFWLFEDHTPLGDNFLGSVPYYNRGAAVVNMIMGLCMALYFFHLRNMRRRMEKSGPHLVLLPIIFVLYGVLWMSSSRAGIVGGSLMVICFILWVLISTFGGTDSTFLRTFAVMFFAGVVVAAVFSFKKLPNLDRVLKDFSTLETSVDEFQNDARYKVSKVTWEMFEDRKWIGWGAGSWRFVYPYYQMKYPDLGFRADGTGRINDNPNNDWFQYLSELGIVGSSLLLLVVIAPFAWFLFRIQSVRIPHVVLVMTLLELVAHGLVETLFQNQTILALSGFVVVMLFKFPRNRASTLS